MEIAFEKLYKQHTKYIFLAIILAMCTATNKNQEWEKESGHYQCQENV